MVLPETHELLLSRRWGPSLGTCSALATLESSAGGGCRAVLAATSALWLSKGSSWHPKVSCCLHCAVLGQIQRRAGAGGCWGAAGRGQQEGWVGKASRFSLDFILVPLSPSQLCKGLSRSRSTHLQLAMCVPPGGSRNDDAQRAGRWANLRSCREVAVSHWAELCLQGTNFNHA